MQCAFYHYAVQARNLTDNTCLAGYKFPSQSISIVCLWHQRSQGFLHQCGHTCLPDRLWLLPYVYIAAQTLFAVTLKVSWTKRYIRGDKYSLPRIERLYMRSCLSRICKLAMMIGGWEMSLLLALRTLMSCLFAHPKEQSLLHLSLLPDSYSHLQAMLL